MKQNRLFLKSSLIEIKENIEKVKKEMSDDLQLNNKDFVKNCTALDEYYIGFRANLIKNIKNIKNMKRLVAISKFVLNVEIKQVPKELVTI
jgi:hypothetical protein